MELDPIFQLSIVCFGFLNTLHILRNPSKMSILDILIFSASIVFGLTPFLTTMISGQYDYVSSRLSMLTYTTVVLFFAGTMLVMFIERVVQNRRGKTNSFNLFKAVLSADRVRIAPVLIIFVACILLRLFIAINYGILFSGTGTEANISNLPYRVVILRNFLQLFEWGYGVWASWMVMGKTRGHIKIVAATMVIFLIFLMFLEGRRWVFAFIIEFFCIALLKMPRFKLRLVISALIVILVAGFILFPLFLKIRSIYQMAPESGNALRDLADALVQFKENGEDVIGGEGMQYLAENLSTRPSVTVFLMDILDRQEMISPMNGDALKSVIQWSIPHLLYKEKLLELQTKQFIQFYYGMKLSDTSISWVAIGAADFGALGGLFVGICFGLLLVFMNEVSVRFSRKVPFVGLCLLGGMINFVMIFEQDPSAIIVLFRDSCALFLLFLFGGLFKRKVLGLKKQKSAVYVRSIGRH